MDATSCCWNHRVPGTFQIKYVGRRHMRIGLVGAGRIGARHARTLAAFPQVGALLIADADPARARALAASAGSDGVARDARPQTTDAVGSVGELFAARPDAVVVAASTDVHAELVLQAI